MVGKHEKLVATTGGLFFIGLTIFFYLSPPARDIGRQLAASLIGYSSDTNEIVDILNFESYPTIDIDRDDIDMLEKVDLNGDGQEDVIVRVRNEAVCGNTGCPHEILLRSEGSWERLEFGYSGNDLKVKSTRTDGYADIEINGTTLRWDGWRYRANHL